MLVGDGVVIEQKSAYWGCCVTSREVWAGFRGHQLCTKFKSWV